MWKEILHPLEEGKSFNLLISNIGYQQKLSQRRSQPVNKPAH
jgi:hypothetical protein